MPTTFDKLNLKDQSEIVIVNAPKSLEHEIASLRGVAVRRDLKDAKEITFSLAFVTKQNEVDSLGKAAVKKASGDAVIWFAYPKKSSKNYTCEFNRDNGWDTLWNSGFEPVRMVAIDEDWSAVRFRRKDLIKAKSSARTALRDKARRGAGS
jgi:hypothetical protein